MTLYLVTTATDYHQTCVKLCLRDVCTATESGRGGEKSAWKNSIKALLGGGACLKPKGLKFGAP